MYKARLDKLAAWLQKPPGVTWEEFDQARRRITARIAASISYLLEGAALVIAPGGDQDWETTQRWKRQRGIGPAEDVYDAQWVRQKLGLSQ